LHFSHFETYSSIFTYKTADRRLQPIDLTNTVGVVSVLFSIFTSEKPFERNSEMSNKLLNVAGRFSSDSIGQTLGKLSILVVGEECPDFRVRVDLFGASASLQRISQLLRLRQ
jgi:hypothetical protein